MSEYIDVYVRRGEELNEEELEWLKGFQKAWEWQTWGKVEQWFSFNGRVIDSMSFSAILRDYLRGVEKPMIDALEEIVKDEFYRESRYREAEAIDEVYKKFEFLESVVDLFLMCGSKVAIGSEYLEDEGWVKFDGGDEG